MSITTTGEVALTHFEAFTGGDVELPLLSELSGPVAVESENAGSKINLAMLADFPGGSLTVTNQGSVSDPVLTTLSGVSVTLDGTGTLAISNWASVTSGAITVTSGTYSFAGLTDIDGSSVESEGGVNLSLPIVQSYTEPNFAGAGTLEASGANSVLSLPALVSIATTGEVALTHVEAFTGGDVELPLLSELSGPVAVESENAGSKINLAMLADFPGGSLTVTNQGSVSDLVLTTLSGVSVTLDGTGTLAISNWASVTSGAITVTSGTYSFAGLTDIDGSSVESEGGVNLSLPIVQSYTEPNFAGAGTLEASGANSVLSLPKLVSITTTGQVASSHVDALAGGDVELPLITQLAGVVSVESENAGSLVDMPVLTTLNGGSFTITAAGSLVAPALTTVISATITTDSTAAFSVQAGQTLSFPSGITTFNTGDLLDQGMLNVQGNAELVIRGSLTINGQGGLSTSSGSVLEVSGNLLGTTQNAAGFNPLGTVVLNGNGTSSSPQLLEAMSQDLGNVAAGFSNNFAYGTLQLAANTYVELVDNAANSPGNSPQALYVNDLIVPAGATLNLDGLQLYVHTEQINGTIMTGGAVVSGEVYDDFKRDGTLDSGDPGLSGWTVELNNTSTNSTYTTTTNSSGLYSLSGVAAGTYTLSEVLRPGFAQTAPVAPSTFTITVVSGQTVSNENFGNQATASINGKVYNDLNGDGSPENGEPGLSGWTVNLLNASGQTVGTAMTGLDGSYSFSALLPRTYTVQVASKSGYVASSLASVQITDINGAADSVKFGEFVPATISGLVFNDPNDTGAYVTGDAVLSGWTVELVIGATVLSTTSGSNGTYSFSNVGPGTYTLEVVQQTGWVATNAPISITPSSGSSISGEGLGEIQTTSINGQVFADLSGSGTFVSTDPGLSGWTIETLNAEDTVVSAAHTASDGDYSLTGIGPGSYTVLEIPESGYIQTTAPAIYHVTIVQGQNLTGINFGDFQLATVNGEIFDDLNDDGNLDQGDPGLAAWTVNLLNGFGKVGATATTNASGDYSFTAVGPGIYTIAAVTQPGYVQTAPASGNLTVSSSSGATFNSENFGAFKAVSLAVSGLSTKPSSGLQSGMNLVAQWTDTNTGTLAASGPFVDQVVITNTTTGTVLATGDVVYNAASLGNLTPGASATQQFAFTLPNGDPGVGQINFTVIADGQQSVSTPAGEPNDTATLTEASTLAPYPELIPSAVAAPASVNPGQATTIGWNLTNSGAGTASGPWTEQVYLATDSFGDNLTLLAAQNFTGSLGAGQSVSRSMDVQAPSLATGNYWFVVVEDPPGEVFELNNTTDTGIAAQSTSLAGGLSLTLASSTENNAAGSNATTATVTRNTSTTNALQITITNSDSKDVTAPQSVTIPAGATSVTFAVGTINNHVVEGTQAATLTASAGGLVSGAATLTVTDTNAPTLTVVLNSHSVNETDTNPATFGTVTTNDPTDTPLVVSLLSNNINKLTVPITVTIPAGETSATFPVTVVNDGQIDGNETVTITSSASGFQSGSDSAVVVDDNVPALTLSLAQTTVSEAAGADATIGTVSIASPAVQPLTIVLGSSDTSAATVPASVVIDAGQESASFPIAAVNDGLASGNKTAAITANVETDAGVIVVQGSAEAKLLLLAANGPALSVSFAASTVHEGSSTTGTVTRNTDITDALVVILASSNPSEATAPATVTIPAGSASATFPVNSVQNDVPIGMESVQISATASGRDTGLATLNITDVQLPDLVVSNVTAPSSGYDNVPLSISWTVTNTGQYPAAGAWVDDVYLDPAGGPQSTTPADSVSFTALVAPGQSYTQSDTITAPSNVGEYFVRVVTDSGASVQELAYSNNTGVAGQPYNDEPAYTTTVTPSASVVSAGTPVVLWGVATLTSDNDPAANVPVAIQILVDGTTRTLTGTTNASGDYSVTFQPLPDEAGNYSVTAADPGVTNPAVQAQFTIVGMTATPATANVTVVPNTPLTGTFTLTNLSDETLTGLSGSYSGEASGMTVQLTLPSEIAGDGTAPLSYTLSDTSTQGASGVVSIALTSTQGAVLELLVGFTVDPLMPVLTADPGYLDTGMLVGGQTLVSFTVVNNGGAPSGTLQVNLPATPYMTLASPATIPSLAPGASTTVTVELTPPSNLPLEEYKGTIGVNSAQTGISVPFTFTAVTTATGTVAILVDDNATFTVAGSPHVQGATVSLLNPYDNTDVVATGTTDATGNVTFTNVPAGPYDLQVTATGHSSYENSFTVTPGITNSDEVFIEQQFVTYTWNVVQTTIQDTYQIQLQTTFATDVPAPVVTMTTPTSLPTLVPGQSWTFNATITNHGLIAAQGVTLTMPTDPEYSFTALTTDIGVLPAQSSVLVPITVTRIAPTTVSLTQGDANVTATVSVPNPVGQATASTVYVHYKNTGTKAIPAPLLVLTASQGSSSGGFLSLNPALAGLAYNSNATPAGFSDSVQFLASGATPGLLEPGESIAIPIYYAGWAYAEWTPSIPVTFSLTEVGTDDTDPIDWATVAPGLQLGSINNAAWSVIAPILVQNMGSTWGDYIQTLDNDAAYLAGIGQPTTDVDQLLEFEIEKANAGYTAQTVTTVTADLLPAPGIDLSFAQSFQLPISGRYTRGILGYGWTNNWDTTAMTLANGDVVLENDGLFKFFSLQPGGGYTPEPGDEGMKLTFANGAYQLLQPNGIDLQFNGNGTLDYVQDTHGNRITCGYNAQGQLVSLTGSNGEYLVMVYNSQGDLATLTDSNGQTETYGYDPTGQYLTSYTDSFGTTTYTYVTGESPAQNNALAEIAYADNTHVYIAYDSDGRLIDLHRDNGQEDETWSYLTPGGYVTTDGNGNQATTYFDEFGEPDVKIDPLGNVTRSSHDTNLDVTRVVQPGGSTYTYTYDANGNLTSETDPLSLTTAFTYNTNNDLTSYTDPKGNTTSYSYDAANDLLSITYANGTQQSYTYNPLGEATQYLNADGQAIGYTYNSQGLIATESFADGTSYSYTYNSQGNLSTATDAEGNVETFLYGDASNPNLLTGVEYPDGTWLKFSYNIVGQRTQSVDQTGFTVNYLYNALGRLSELTDGNGNLIVKYTYDAAGNLIQKDNGNGTRTVYTYDKDGDVLSITNYAPDHVTVNSFDDYTYDELGNVKTDTSQDGEWSYSYDADSQLLQAVFAPNSSDPDGLTAQDLQYVYDDAGNRISETVDGVTTTYVTNNANEYTTSSTNGVTTSYQYDANGNLIGQIVGGSTTSYTYNDLNQLTTASGPGESASYAYDPLGSLISQTINGATTHYMVDPVGLGNIVASYGATGGPVTHYVYGITLVSQVSPTTGAAFYDFNNLGSTVGVTNASGHYVNSYNYAPFGQLLSSTQAIATPFQFIGSAGVVTTGNGLDSMRARFYNSSEGRFASPDPINISGGINVYTYGNNNPIRHSDPTGLLSCKEWVVLTEIAVGTIGLGVSAYFLVPALVELSVAGGASEIISVGFQRYAFSAAYDVKTIGDVSGLVGGPLGGFFGAIFGDALANKICTCLCPPKKKSNPQPDNCTLIFTGAYFTFCLNQKCNYGFASPTSVPGRDCSAHAVQLALGNVLAGEAASGIHRPWSSSRRIAIRRSITSSSKASKPPEPPAIPRPTPPPRSPVSTRPPTPPPPAATGLH